MTTNATLGAEKRDQTGKGAARRLRAAGRVPGVVYGQGGEATTVTVDAREAGQLFQKISVENTIVELAVDGESIQTLVREVQVHPFKPILMHIDFYKVQKGMTLDVDIPIHLIGTPVGVKAHGGVVQQVVHELAVRTIPSLIPESIEVDISELDVGDSLHVDELEIPEGVEVQLDPERTVCTVAVPKALVTAEDEAAAAEAEAAELEGEDGEAEEGAEGAEDEAAGAESSEGDTEA